MLGSKLASHRGVSDVLFPLGPLLTVAAYLFFALSAATLSAQLAALPPAPERDGIETEALRQESVGALTKLSGDVELRTKNVVIRADNAEYDELSGEITAVGNVNYRSRNGKEDLYAEKVAFNIKTGLGTFYDVHGTVSAASQGGVRLLTTDNPFYIDGKIVQKTEAHYEVYDGTVTNCDPNDMWWTLRSPKTTIVPGQYAVIRRGVFRLKGVPLLYVPYFRKSLERLPRRSGFLAPNIGNSSRFGFVLGQSYYWAINRSFDATGGLVLYTQRGVAGRGEFRGRPTPNSDFTASYYGVKDRGEKLDDGSRLKQGGHSFSARGTALFPWGLRGVMDLEYISSLAFRQVFTQSYSEAVNSQIRSIGFVSKNFSSFSLNASLQRDENFQTTDAGDTVVIRKLPSVEFNSHSRELLGGPVPLFLSFDSEFGLVSRTQTTFQTRRFVQRGDFYPRVSTRFAWKGFRLRPTFGARQTSYGQQRDGNDLIGTNLHRRVGEISLDLIPPSLARIYDGPKAFGPHKLKHVIETRARYRYVRGVDDFNSVIRFDDRDLINNTNEAEFGLINRLYVKNTQTGQVREVASLEIWQRRYFDPSLGGAIVPGRRNVSRSTIDLTSFAFADGPRNYSPIVTALKLRPSWRWSLEWRNDYDPLRQKLVNSSVNANYQLSSLVGIGLGHQAVRVPTTLSAPTNQISTDVRFGGYNRRGWNVAVRSLYDYRQKQFVYIISQATYNTDCCGFGFEFRRLALGSIRNENQVRVSLSISNVGSFGTLNTRERLF